MKTLERSEGGRSGWSSRPAPRSLSPLQWSDTRPGLSDGLRKDCDFQLLWKRNKEERVNMKNMQGGTNDANVRMFVFMYMGE